MRRARRPDAPRPDACRARGPHPEQVSAAPDAPADVDDLGLRLARFALTDARAGRLALTPTVRDGRDVLLVEITLPANRCRRLAAGTARLWLTRSTLLPRRLEVERRGRTRVTAYAFSGFNQTFAIRELARPVPLGSAPQRVNHGFRRRTPEAASRPLPFVPRLPTALPSGYRLAVSGWAPRGARTGAGDVNPRDPSLSSVVYVRGWERIEVTQRVMPNGVWRADPFGESCVTMRRGRTVVGSRPGHYGIAAEIPSHLWWRDGPFLFTVSGPYGKADLAVIAASLRRID